MAMQMIVAGGIPPITDSLRAPDEDNPRGYFEFERVKSLRTDKAWLDDARGKVVKVIHMLLTELPDDRVDPFVGDRPQVPGIALERVRDRPDDLPGLGVGHASLEPENVILPDHAALQHVPRTELPADPGRVLDPRRGWSDHSQAGEARQPPDDGFAECRAGVGLRIAT